MWEMTKLAWQLGKRAEMLQSLALYHAVRDRLHVTGTAEVDLFGAQAQQEAGPMADAAAQAANDTVQAAQEA